MAGFLEPQEARTQPHPYQGHGCWAGLPIVPLQQHSGWAFTLDATPSSYEARQKHGVTLLMDMSTFYDTIHLSRLQEEAVKLGYPVLLLELAMQLYCGPTAILAEQEMTPFFHADHGIPAGHPCLQKWCLRRWFPGRSSVHRLISQAGLMMWYSISRLTLLCKWPSKQ